MMADHVTFASILAERIKEDPTIIKVDDLWNNIMMAIESMSKFNEENKNNPPSLAFYDESGDLWQIQKCGSISTMDEDKI